MPEDKAAELIGSMRQYKGLLCRHHHPTGKTRAKKTDLNGLTH
jgi:hypothetical protein